MAGMQLPEGIQSTHTNSLGGLLCKTIFLSSGQKPQSSEKEPKASSNLREKAYVCVVPVMSLFYFCSSSPVLILTAPSF